MPHLDFSRFIMLLMACVIASPFAKAQEAPNKRIVFLAGVPSHGYGSHEHLAGSRILAAAISSADKSIKCDVYPGGWPDDDKVLDGADSIVMYCDGGLRHPALKHLPTLAKHMDRGVGFVCLHYGVEVPAENGGAEFLKWLGGYFEMHWSVNPHWTADYKQLPIHAVTRGVQPFSANDEWYFHMRFQPEMKGVTPILSAVPPESTLSRKDGPHSGNPAVRAAVARQEPQHMAWVYERVGGGRSFGFTGGHYHWNWGRTDILRLVSNAIAWTAHREIPTSGLAVQAPTLQSLEQGQDEKIPANHDSETIKKNFKLTSTLDSSQRPEISAAVSNQFDSQASDSQRTARKNRAKGVRAKQAASNNSAIANDTQVRTPETAVAGLTVHPELEVTLVAAEPQLKSLTNLDIDHRGRIWVCEVVNYRRHNGERPTGDRILILEDTNQDGKADTTKVYYEGRDIDSAMGICVLGNKVIVSSSPNVWVFTDNDGDDKPDRQELLFSKTGDPQHDHSAHSFIFGPDGKLYWNFGNTGRTVHDANGKIVVDMAGNEVRDVGKPYRNGMPFRCNLDGSEFEVLGHNFRNNYEVTVDSFGTLWQSDNDDDGNRAVRINYVMEFGNYGYVDEVTGAGWRTDRTNLEPEIPQRHWHLNDPGVVPTLLLTGAGSPTGICVYEGDLLPRIFRNQVIHCDAGPNVVRAYPVKKSGAGFTAESVNLVVGDKDTWFRPADVCVAPDGSLFVTDWYDPGVGGHNMQDMERGRLFRIAPPGVKYTVPKFDFGTPEGAVAALANPNLAVRYMAFDAISKFGDAAVPALKVMATRQNSRYRARALWALGKLPNRGEETIQLALRDADPDIRTVAIRLARQLKIAPDKSAQRHSRDAAEVRRELAIALRHDNSESMPKIWADLAVQYDGQDRWYLEALGIASDLRPAQCLDAFLEKVGQHWASANYRDILWRIRAPKAAQYIAMMLANPNLAPSEVPRLFRALDFHTPEARNSALSVLLKYADNHSGKTPEQIARLDWLAVEALLRSSEEAIKGNTPLQAAVARYLESKSDRAEHIRVLRHIRLPDIKPRLLAIALHGDIDSSSVAATEMLLRRNIVREITETLADQQNSVAATRAATIVGLCNDPVAIELLTECLDKDGFLPQVRTEAAKGLARTPGGAKWLLAKARENKLPPDIRLVAGSGLRANSAATVRSEAEQLFPAPKAASKNPLPPLAELVTKNGDITRGQEVFRGKGTCANCHIVSGFGKSVGPELTEIGSKLSPEAMYVSILDPSAGISFNFEAYAALLESGQVITGLLISRTDQQVVIRDSQGIDRVLDSKDVEELKKQSKSLMPDNLQEAMSAQELVDVVAYMLSLKKK